MKSRAYRARVLSLSKPKKKVVKEKSEEVISEQPTKEKQGIKMIDPQTGDVKNEFDSFEAAVEAGFSLPNLKGAVKNGNKYKGHLWAEVK